MGWGNGIGIGWPNATSGSTPIVYESYIYSSCINAEQFDTGQYPQGTFQVFDRVTYPGYSDYGKIIGVLSPGSGVSIIDLPINDISTDRPCIDSNINIGIEAILSEVGVVSCNIGAGITGIVVDNNTGSFPISFNINWTADVEDGEGSATTINGVKTMNFVSPIWPIGSSLIAENVVLDYLSAGWYTTALTASISGFSIENSTVFDLGWINPNLYLTTYGNTWQFQYPTA